MADLIFAGIALAFFALCLAYVFACDRIIGTRHAVDPSTGVHSTETTDVEVTRP